MEHELTAEYAQGYMDGAVATREEITKMIHLELDKRQEPPLPIKHWTNFILAMINRNDRTEEQVLEQSTKEYLQDLQANGDMPSLIMELMAKAMEQHIIDEFDLDDDDDEE